MSDIMLIGVLRMPPELWGKGAIDVAQRHEYYKAAADRIEQDEARIWNLEAKLQEMAKVLGAFLRAPHIGSDGPGSSKIVVQEYNLNAARAVLKAPMLDGEQ